MDKFKIDTPVADNEAYVTEAVAGNYVLLFNALGERDANAEICRDSKGRPEPDSGRCQHGKTTPLPPGTRLPLPMQMGPDKPNDELVEAFRAHIDEYMANEVLPHVLDAWVDLQQNQGRDEIPINRHFYTYEPPRPLAGDRVGDQRVGR